MDGDTVLRLNHLQQNRKYRASNKEAEILLTFATLFTTFLATYLASAVYLERSEALGCPHFCA